MAKACPFNNARSTIGDIVQVLHSADNHWLTVSTVVVDEENTVGVYESLGLYSHPTQEITLLH